MITLAALVWSGVALAAPCPAHVYTEASEVRVTGDAALIVTNPSTRFDGRFASKLGVDAAVRYAKKKKMPVVYLQDSNTASANDSYFFTDCNPTYWVQSTGGEFTFDVATRKVIAIGGDWESSLATTLAQVMKLWSKMPAGDLTLTIPMDAVYSSGKFVEVSDPYRAGFETFIRTVMYGRPEAANFVKLTLLETMAMIEDPKLQAEFLKRNLVDHKILSSDYRVELKLAGWKTEVLQEGKADKPPKLKLEFKTSLYNNGAIRTKE